MTDWKKRKKRRKLFQNCKSGCKSYAGYKRHVRIVARGEKFNLSKYEFTGKPQRVFMEEMAEKWGKYEAIRETINLIGVYGYMMGQLYNHVSFMSEQTDTAIPNFTFSWDIVVARRAYASVKEDIERFSADIADNSGYKKVWKRIRDTIEYKKKMCSMMMLISGDSNTEVKVFDDILNYMIQLKNRVMRGKYYELEETEETSETV